ncbi:MAG: Uma2 family endonuclease [Cyanobacteriota bacterium]|nr:Uma2 family endonuclease [Cyanobacteriota bacterium]
MTQALYRTSFSDFDEFINWYPEESEYHYELHNGVITQMPKPRGKHSQIAGFLMAELSLEIRHLGLPYFIPKECIVKTDNLSGYEPDVIVVNRDFIQNEPRWEKESTSINGQSIKLVIEVVSSNWSDDYALKLDAYEIMGIKEYWIVDYLGLGGRKFIGYPKQPTFTVNTLENGEYKSTQFKDKQLIQSSIFPGLKLTVEQIFRAE